MISGKNILFIAPVPTVKSGKPVTGNALPVIKTIEILKQENNISIIDLSREIKSGFSLLRMMNMFSIFYQVYRSRKDKDIIYLTVAESTLGNLRDIVIYILCFSKVKNIIIHMLGGANIKNIFNPNNGIIFRVNRFFISQMGAVIVEGEDQKKTFANVISEGKIFINPNFAEDYLFISNEDFNSKFQNLDIVKVLFLSNHLEGKGHEELSSAYLHLNKDYKSKITIDFVGKFPDLAGRKKFENKISTEPNLKYHGPLSGEAKRNMYQQSHVFCLPTYYPYEGQPFCIVESYAAGCMVITTNHSGIGQIFKDNINGYEVEKKSIESLKNALIKAVDNKHTVKDFALNNLNEAKEKYTLQKYLETQQTILETIK